MSGKTNFVKYLFNLHSVLFPQNKTQKTQECGNKCAKNFYKYTILKSIGIMLKHKRREAKQSIKI
jgi:hypothetical protein